MLSAQDAEAIVQGFFVNMLCSTPARIRQIVKNVDRWNTGETASLAAQNINAPLALQQVYLDIAFLTRYNLATVLQFIQRNLKLVELNNHWATIRSHLVAMDEEGAAIRDHLRLPAPVRGQTYITLVKTELYTRASIQPAKFGNYLRDSYIPYSLVKTFGTSNLLLYPTNSEK